MRTSAAYRVSSHVCLFLAAAAISPLFLSALWLPFVTAALILAADLVAVCIDNKLFRAAVAAVPLLVLPFSNSVYSAIILACPIIYSIAVIASGRFALEIWRLRSEAKIILILCLPVLLVAQLAGFEYLFGLEYPKEPTYCSWALIFCTVMLVFLSLRAARTGSQRSFDWQKNNVIWFFAPLAVAIPLGFFIVYAFVPVMKFVAIVLSAPLFALIWLGNIIFTGVFNENLADWETTLVEEETEIDFETEVHAVGGEGGAYEYFRKATKLNISKETLIIIGLSLLALLLITVIILVIRRSVRVKGGYVNDGKFAESDEQTHRRRGRKRSAKGEATGADRIRFTYRQYLAFLKMHGIVPDKSCTSSEISDEARTLLRETDELLRGLYIKARYGRASDVTDAEAELAAETYLRLVNDKNIKPITERQ